eukprot:6101616-Prymnesium_polylepis.1
MADRFEGEAQLEGLDGSLQREVDDSAEELRLERRAQLARVLGVGQVEREQLLLLACARRGVDGREDLEDLHEALAHGGVVG